ncbi:MAG: PorP/SprF family type IX secretion system membrane protein [Saprospiraceae bacterium]|nr:PorP/SprF family type IX secretion system membrane protein [Saprospiraceae bacterium]
MRVNLFGIILSIFGSFITSHGFGQDLVYTQFYNNPMMLNPAMTGLKKAGRLAINYRNQWPGLNKAYSSYSIGYDRFFDDYQSGVGIYLFGDNAGNGIWKTYQAKLNYAYALDLGDKKSLSMGFDFGIINSSIDAQKLILGEQIDPESGYYPGFATTDIPENGYSLTKFDASVGLLFYSEKIYGGLSFHHATFPNLKFFKREDNLDNTLPLKINLHVGTNFELIESSRDSWGMSISPVLLLSKQGDFYQLQGQALFTYGQLLMGLGARLTPKNTDAALLTIGGVFDYFKISYSYDLTLSGLSSRSQGAHEASLVFSFGDDPGLDINDCMKLFR